jgi:LPXTG-motif cell wall-anchored protein
MYRGGRILAGCLSGLLAMGSSLALAGLGDLSTSPYGLTVSSEGTQVGIDPELGISANVDLETGESGIVPYSLDSDAIPTAPSPIPQNLEVIPPGAFFDCFGDINMDGVTDMSDLAILQVNFGKSPATKAEGDLNGDGIVDNADFALLQANFQNVVIPEPTSALIWSGLLLVGGAFYVSRRRKSHG